MIRIFSIKRFILKTLVITLLIAVVLVNSLPSSTASVQARQASAGSANYALSRSTDHGFRALIFALYTAL